MASDWSERQQVEIERTQDLTFLTSSFWSLVAGPIFPAWVWLCLATDGLARMLNGRYLGPGYQGHHQRERRLWVVFCLSQLYYLTGSS